MGQLYKSRGWRWREEWRDEGRQEGRPQGERDALVRLAERRFGWRATQFLADLLGDHPRRDALTRMGEVIFACDTANDFMREQLTLMDVHDWRERARKEGREEGRKEGERDALVKLAGRRFGGVAGQHLAGTLDARPDMLTEASDLIVACETTEEFIYSLGGPHGC